MPAMSVQDMIQTVRDITDDTQDDMYTDAQIVRYLNLAVGYYDGILANHAVNLIQRSKDVTHDGSTELRRIQPYLPRIISVERTDQSPRVETPPVEGGFRDRFKHLGDSASYGSYYVQGGQVGVVPIPASGTERFWFYYPSPELHYGTCGAYAEGATDTATSIILAATPTQGNLMSFDDAYNESQVMLTTTRELNVISDYTRSTRKAAVGFTWENQPVSSTTVYSILPRLHPDYHSLVPYRAVRLGNMQVDEDNAEIDKEILLLEQNLKSFIRSFTDQSNRRVRISTW